MFVTHPFASSLPEVKLNSICVVTRYVDFHSVHLADFMFQAFKNGHQGKESAHDVYCSACGVVIARSRWEATRHLPCRGKADAPLMISGY